MKELTKLSKALRKRATNAEQLLWKYLKVRQMEGLKFRRQEPIDGYIVDFVCFEKRLVIEVDGGQHAEYIEKDIERDGFFREQGFTVLRFWNNDVLQNIQGVLLVIRKSCALHPPLHPLPSAREGDMRISEGGTFV